MSQSWPEADSPFSGPLTSAGTSFLGMCVQWLQWYRLEAGFSSSQMSSMLEIQLERWVSGWVWGAGREKSCPGSPTKRTPQLHQQLLTFLQGQLSRCYEQRRWIVIAYSIQRIPITSGCLWLSREYGRTSCFSFSLGGWHLAPRKPRVSGIISN